MKDELIKDAARVIAEYFAKYPIENQLGFDHAKNYVAGCLEEILGPMLEDYENFVKP